MGLVNQGWLCRCDVCEGQADASIGGYTKSEIIRIAKARGFICLRISYWFCSADCLRQWIAEKELIPGFQGSLMDDAKKLLERV